jgi:hypothetical protein
MWSSSTPALIWNLPLPSLSYAAAKRIFHRTLREIKQKARKAQKQTSPGEPGLALRLAGSPIRRP